MENVVMTLFNVESEAYQAFSELKSLPQTEALKISEAILVKKSEGTLDIKDKWFYDDESSSDAIIGGFLGGLIGIIGGPLGMLLGYGVGAMVGAATGSLYEDKEDTLVDTVSKKLLDGDVAIISLVQEENESHYNHFFMPYNIRQMRWSVDDVTHEIEAVQETEEELAHLARMELTKKRQKAYEERKDEVSQAVKETFDKISKFVKGK